MNYWKQRRLKEEWNKKADIITELHKREIISEDGYKEYMLSENSEFNPTLNVNTP